MLDALITALSPAWAAKRAQARHVLRLYDAAKSTPQNRMPTGRHSGDGLMAQAADKPRTWARHLDENVDLITGLLNTLSSQAAALTIEPQAKTPKGELHEDLNGQLSEAFDTWSRNAEVSGTYTWTELIQLIARSWLRDGDVFLHHLESANIDYAGIPYGFQALESDYVPFELTQGDITHGIVRNRLGQPTAYHVWQEHPGNTLRPVVTLDRTIALPAANVTHLRRVQRFHQARGITLLHPIIRRLDDLNDYEQSERIAARIASSVCLAVTKTPGYESPDINATTGEREWYMQAGQVFDNMLPGESIDMLNPTRPSDQAGPWRQLQLKAIATGTDANYSTIARDYSGSYSAQRQELVETQFQVRRRLQGPMIERVLMDIYPRFVRQAILSGTVKARGADAATLTKASYNPGSVSWIDMLKEVQAEAEAVKQGFKSRSQVIRERGGDPHKVQRELDADVFKPAGTEGESNGVNPMSAVS